MKNNVSILLLILFALTACVASPQYLGFSKAEWKNMDSSKRKELLRNYKQIHSTKQSIDSEKDSEESEENADGKKVVAIHVLIAEGKVMMPPFTEAYSYKPVSFTIAQGHCTKVLMEEAVGKHHIEMEACFKKNVLLLDPSRYDSTKIDGSARLYRSPLWRNGFTYTHINSTGYARLRDVSIKIYD